MYKLYIFLNVCFRDLAVRVETEGEMGVKRDGSVVWLLDWEGQHATGM